MSWLVDHAGAAYVLLAVIAAGFVLAWRFDRRARNLALALAVSILGGLLWIVLNYVPAFTSDRKQLKESVQAMASAVKEGKMDALFKHISKDFRYKGMTRDVLYEKARGAIEGHEVSDVKITKFDVDDLDRAKKFAKTSFRVSAWGRGNEVFMFVTKADFVLEGDQWKLKTMAFFNPMVDQDQEINLPLP